jgi:hypothetical protein
LVFATAWGASAWAQDPPQYLENPAKEPANGKALVPNMVRSGVINDRALFDAYFRWKVDEMTLISSIKTIHSKRGLLKTDLRTSGNAERMDAHTALTQFLLREMQVIAKGNYHPVCRYNAMLVIADLNDTELKPGGSKVVPMAGALAVLVAEYSSAQNPDFVRVAALGGILRHCEAGLSDPANRAQIADLAIQLASLTDQPADRDPLAHAWFRSRAVDVLAAFGSPSIGEKDNRVVSAYHSILTEENAPEWFKLVVCKDLGNLDFSGSPDAPFAEVAREMAELWCDIVDRQVALARAKNPAPAGDGMMFPGGPSGGDAGGMGPAGMGGMGGMGLGGSGGMGLGGSGGDDAAGGSGGAGMPSGYGGAGMPPGMFDDNQKPRKKPDKPVRDPFRLPLQYALRCITIGLNGPITKPPSGGSGAAAAPAASTKGLVGGATTDKEVVDAFVTRMKEFEAEITKKDVTDRELALTLAKLTKDMREWLGTAEPPAAEPPATGSTTGN